MARPPEDTATPRRAPTMADVARLAGVSHQTVSRVLGDHPNVRPATRAQVRRAIEELGYRRNPSARALVTRRTRTVGVVACNPTLYGPASTLVGLQEAAMAEGYLVSAVTLRRFDADALADAVEGLGDWGVEGVVVMVPQGETVAALESLDPPFPVVTVEGGHDLPIPGVCVDQELGGRMVTSHLLAAGHRTVWHVAGPQNWLEAGARLRGWRRTLEEAGARVPPVIEGDWTPLSGYRAGQELAGRALAGGAGLSAVFVGNDQMAVGVLRAFREAGIAVPGQVAIAGFDDIPEAEFLTPPLTTVRQDFTAVGEASIRLLVDRIESAGPRGAAQVVIEPRLIVRGSTTPA
ncbi:LacI family DNA-binding transcriptional regulator [Streptomyces tremellae]